MAAITKKSTIGEVLNMNIETARFLMEIGMHCLGCAMASGETLEQACLAHDVDPDAFLEQLRTYLESL